MVGTNARPPIMGKFIVKVEKYTVGEGTVALKIIACCSITQTPTGQWNIENIAD